VDIPKFLELGEELETIASKLYEGLSGLTTDPAIGRQLKSLAAEELNHARIIRTGKTYCTEMPDLFIGLTLDDAEVLAVMEEARSAHASLAPGDRLLERLKKMFEMERHFERFHVAASIRISEPSLHKLLADMSKGDQSHMVVLKQLIEMLS
jgi:rubrerythrin